MKIILVNGSHNEFGCTYTALNIISKKLESEGIASEIIWLGLEAINDFNGKRNTEDIVNLVGNKMKEADGLIVGTPTWYSHPTGKVLCFLDRLSTEYGKYLAYKPAASIASARRAGQVISNDIITKHFSINSMPIITSTYWNLVYGSTPEEVLADEEGVATMENLAANMAWILKAINKSGLSHPEPIRKCTSFHH